LPKYVLLQAQKRFAHVRGDQQGGSLFDARDLPFSGTKPRSLIIALNVVMLAAFPR